jgi:hypothetical protein
VELSVDLKECPLCNTPVWNLNMKYGTPEQGEPDFPTESGDVESVDRRDLGILLTAFVLGTSVTCGLLNLLAFSASPWSLAIIGLCILLWVMAIPALYRKHQSIYSSLILDSLAIGLYLYLISFMTKNREWLTELALPITLLVLIVALSLTGAIRKFPKSFLTGAFILFTAIGILCIGLEFLLDRFFHRNDLQAPGFSLGWSAIVLTVCIILDITVVTLLSRRRLRSEVRRRFHF